MIFVKRKINLLQKLLFWLFTFHPTWGQCQRIECSVINAVRKEFRSDQRLQIQSFTQRMDHPDQFFDLLLHLSLFLLYHPEITRIPTSLTNVLRYLYKDI